MTIQVSTVREKLSKCSGFFSDSEIETKINEIEHQLKETINPEPDTLTFQACTSDKVVVELLKKPLPKTSHIWAVLLKHGPYSIT